jgi:hypothetical protein
MEAIGSADTISYDFSRHCLSAYLTMVGSLSGTHGMFMQNGYGGTESHFGVGHDGRVYQWQDLDYAADANYRGSRRVISIETADYGEGPFGRWDTGNSSLVPTWTPQQIEACAQIIAWCCRHYNIPCELIPDSRPGRRGIGYHRQGVPNKKGATVSQTGGELWSTSVGKACPGNKRIAQIPQIIARARQLLGGAQPQPQPTPTRPVKRRDNKLTHIDIPPGNGNRRFIQPTGAGVVVTERAWISAAVNGPQTGRIRLWCQSNSKGLNDTGGWKEIGFNERDGLSNIFSWELPSGTAQVNVHWEFPNGGTLTIESLARA